MDNFSTSIADSETGGFNPRAHAGRDNRLVVKKFIEGKFQSTPFLRACLVRPRGFNPRAHAGRDRSRTA